MDTGRATGEAARACARYCRGSDASAAVKTALQATGYAVRRMDVGPGASLKSRSTGVRRT